jgi:DNA-binding response OmpR family regulator
MLNKGKKASPLFRRNRMPLPRALIVFDNPTLAGALAGQLSQEGFRVDIVDSGLAAIRQIWEQRYARVIVDSGLRGMRALELANHIEDLAPEAEVTVLTRASQAA